MDNKTNKIKEWVKNLKAKANTIPSLGINSLAGFMLACDDVIAFIDSLEKEPESNTVWHGKDEKPDFGTPILVIDCFGQPYSGYYNGINPRMVENWAYIKDLVNCKECHLEDKSETVSENLDEAATKWDETASFQPFYMQLDGNGNPCEVKQDITTHKESFKAGAEWQKQQDEKLFKEDSWNYIEENYPNITEEEKLRLYDISIKSRIAGANAVKQQMQETLQTEYEKGRFDMREEIEEGAVEFAKSYMEDVNPSFEKVQESEELWKWKMSCLRGINNAYKQGKQDALKNVPKWKKATEHLRGEGFIHYDNHSHMTAEYAYTNVEGGEYYLNINDLKTLPKEE